MKHLQNWLTGTKHLITERWSSWRANKERNKIRVIHLDVEAFDAFVNSKNEFIVYLQDEIAWLRAQLKEERPERVRNEVDFKSNRGYKSVHTRMREQVAFNQRKHEPVTEAEYDKQIVNE